MEHDAIARALCGRYVRLADDAGYVESPISFPSDGTLLGAYVLGRKDGTLTITDDGDLAFLASVAGANLTKSRFDRYRRIADEFGVQLGDDGRLTATCVPDQLQFVLGRFLTAASAIATISVLHRPREDERFERLVGDLLRKQFTGRVTERAEVQGMSGHTLRVPFALDYGRENPVLVQPIAAHDRRTNWGAVYQTGGKFKDIRSLNDSYRLVAVLEASNDTDGARRFLVDVADVSVYDGGELKLAA